MVLLDVLLVATAMKGVQPILTARCTTSVTLKISTRPICRYGSQQVSEPYMSVGSSERLVSAAY